MAEQTKEIQIGPQGRLVVPADLRRELGLNPGGRLLVRVEDGALILEPRQSVERRLQARFSQVDPKVSLADALIAERRAVAGRSGMPRACHRPWFECNDD
ncbi:AbrB/MazE/SpoVT family DNA-binding domain-containing protein [Spiribacter onubensis]|uniref:AbrB/MazE/SpoVT family DNA-binding domain-containing protein n=1 Tax=Spiribacter onubensis TaxID=3122420 RepID=UPI00349F61BD